MLSFPHLAPLRSWWWTSSLPREPIEHQRPIIQAAVSAQVAGAETVRENEPHIRPWSPAAWTNATCREGGRRYSRPDEFAAREGVRHTRHATRKLARRFTRGIALWCAHLV